MNILHSNVLVFGKRLTMLSRLNPQLAKKYNFLGDGYQGRPLDLDKVSDVYKYLFHYTQRSGLEGILKSQSLWATHINFLNDRSEYQYAGETIRPLLLSRVYALIVEKISKSEAARKFVDTKGGVEAFSSSFARNLVRAIYKVTGDNFYVLSLCGDHSSSRVVKNGLLSQWRAYGWMWVCYCFQCKGT